MNRASTLVLLSSKSNVDKAQTFLQEAKLLGKDALQEVRQSIATLRSNPLQGQSLEDAIASLVEDFHGQKSYNEYFKPSEFARSHPSSAFCQFFFATLG